MDNLIQFLGRLHPLIVHLPIGFLLLTACLHGLVWWGKYTGIRELLPLLWFVSCISAVFACLAGYLLSLSGEYEENALNIHMYMGIALAVLTGVVYILLQKGFSAKLQMVGVLLTTGLLMATGHFGGNLTHGEEYLTQPLYAMMGTLPSKIERQPITNVEKALVYRDLVEPVLEQKCWQCHNGGKKKGGLRMDTQEFLLKGGKHGSVLTAGNASSSDLYNRLVLPEENDEHMPPKGKPQLTGQEIQLIYWWITKGGADFTKKASAVEKDDNIKTILASLSTGDSGSSAESNTYSEIPAAKVPRPNPADLQKLKNIGVSFTSLTPDHTYLAVNMVNAPNFTDEQMSLLLKFQERIIWLDLSGTTITDKALFAIAQYKHLTRLSLDNTRITDSGLLQLKKLPALRYLNLYGTAITDQGLKSLESCKNLKVLYVWQTKVTPQGVEALQEAFGEKIEINSGNTASNQL